MGRAAPDWLANVTVALCLASSGQAYAVTFSEQVLQTGLVTGQSVSLANLGKVPHLVVTGEDEQGAQRLKIFGLEGASSEVLALELPAELVAMDISAGPDGESVYFISPRGLERLQFPGQERVLVMQVSSLYRLPRSDRLEARDFLRDVDGDGLDDLLLVDFDGLVFARGLGLGEFGSQSRMALPMSMSLSDEVVRYELPKLFSSDANFDGRLDLLVLEGRQLRVFSQQRAGGFDGGATVLPLGIELPTEAQLRAWDNDGGDVDQSNLSIRRIERLVDLDGDDIIDLLTEVTHSSGVFDKHSEFEVHLGGNERDWIRFRDPPDSVLLSEGIRVDLLVQDLNGDGRQDIMVPSMRVGLGRIIRALFSGTISMRLDFFSMSSEGSYPAKSNFSTNTKVRFDLTSGQVDVPAIRTEDFDGDGLKDLLVQTAPGTLQLTPGDGTDGLFSGKLGAVSTVLPRNGGLVEAMDLDKDGRADLVIRYGKADGAELAGQVRVLLAR
jgi:hypothetical protein